MAQRGRPRKQALPTPIRLNGGRNSFPKDGKVSKILKQGDSSYSPYNTSMSPYNIGAGGYDFPSIGGSGAMSSFAPHILNPTLNPEQFFLPKYQSIDGSPNIELNIWFDHYARFQPLVSNLLQLHCATKDTPLLTEDGYKNIQDATIKDKVIGSQGKFQKIKWTEPTEYEGTFVEVRAVGTIKTEWTANHPFKIKKSKEEKSRTGIYSWFRKSPYGESIWKKAEELELGDYLMYPKFKEIRYNDDYRIDLCDYLEQYKNRGKTGTLKTFEVVDDKINILIGHNKRIQNRYVTINEEFAELIGWYLAEGYISNKNILTLCLHIDENREGERIRELLVKIFGIDKEDVKVILLSHKKTRLIRICSTSICRLILHLCGKGAFNKRIPNEILFNTPNVGKAVIKSFIDGDGCLRNRDMWVVTVSKNLAFQCQLLSTKFNLFLKMRIANRDNCKQKGNGSQYILACSLEDYYNIFESDNNDYKKKVNQIKQYREDNDFYYLPITKLSYTYKKEIVYDICTEDNSFLSTSIVHNSTLPISRFGLVGISDPTVLRYYEEMTDDLQLFEKSIDILFQFYKRGEVMPYGWWDENQNKFKSLTLLDTNYIYVTGHSLLHDKKHGGEVELYEMYPDEYLQALVRSENPMEKELLEHLDPDILEAIENNLSVIIDDFSTTLIRRKLNSWDLRGTSMLTSCLKTLLLEDKLREQMMSYLRANINPVKLWKVGDEKHMADPDMLEATRQLIMQAQYDPEFNVISHHLLSLDIKGAVGTYDKMKDDVDYIQTQILTGLWANKSFVFSEGINYNSSSVGMRVLMGRYLPIRAMLENYFYQKIFLPVALANGFYKKVGKDKVPLIPKFDWRHKQSLMDDASVRSSLISLMQSAKVPMKVVCDSLDLDYEYTKTWLEKEMNTVFDNDIIKGKQTLITSAIAGGLTDTGENMIKRMVDASVQWCKKVLGFSPNLDIDNEPEKEDEGEDKNDENPENEVIKKQKKIFASEYDRIQEGNIERIGRQYSESTGEKLNKGVTSFKPIESSGSIVVKSLKDNGYNDNSIEVIKSQLYDIKILLAKEANDYLYMRKTSNKAGMEIGGYITKIMYFNENDFKERLRQIHISAQEEVQKVTGKTLEKDIPFEYNDLYKINFTIEELNTNDVGVRKAYWEKMVNNLNEAYLNKMVLCYKLSEIETYKELGYNKFYINDSSKKVDIHDKFSLAMQILPNTDYKEKITLNGKDLFINCPIELRNKVVAGIKKYSLSGNYNFEDETFDTIDDTMQTRYIYSKMDNVNNDTLLEMYGKYYAGEDSEEEWFVVNGKQFLKDELKGQDSDLIDFYTKVFLG